MIDLSTRHNSTSSLHGDRLCVHCFYNLKRQPVMQEEHYGLFVVRCPECGQVTPLNDHQVMGRWPGRLAPLLAISWWLVVLAIIASTSGAIVGLSIGTAVAASENLSMDIENFHREESTQITNMDKPQMNFPQWWAKSTDFPWVSNMGGWWNALQKEAFWIWLPLWIMTLIAGSLLGHVFDHPRFPKVLLLIALVIGITFFFTWPSITEWQGENVYWSKAAAMNVMGTPVTLITLGFTILPLTCGLLFGGKLIRWCLRMSLPERFHLSAGLISN